MGRLLIFYSLYQNQTNQYFLVLNNSTIACGKSDRVLPKLLTDKAFAINMIYHSMSVNGMSLLKILDRSLGHKMHM